MLYYVKYHLKVLYAFLRSSYMVCIEYRANFLMNTLFNIAWTTAQIMFISLIFFNISSINGWNKYEMILLFGVDELIFPLFTAFAFSNLNGLEQQVLDGTFDYVLTKPINSQFYTSFRKIDLFQISPIIFGITIILYAKSKLNISIPFLKIVILVVMIIIGVWILYSLFLICVSLTFKFIRASFLNTVILSFIGCMVYPRDIYKGIFRFIITVIIPVGIIVDFPARLLVKVLSIDMILYALLIAVILGTISTITWKIGLKKYTSASS